MGPGGPPGLVYVSSHLRLWDNRDVRELVEVAMHCFSRVSSEALVLLLKDSLLNLNLVFFPTRSVPIMQGLSAMPQI